MDEDENEASHGGGSSIWDTGSWAAGRWAFRAPYAGYAGSAGTGAGTASALTAVLPLLKRRLLGRPLTVRMRRAGEVTLTITDLQVPTSMTELSAGRLGVVEAIAQDVRWRELEASRVHIRARNAHALGGLKLVAAPVEVEVLVSAAALDALLRRQRRGLTVRVAATGEATVGLRGRPGWGHLVVESGCDGLRIWVRPRALVIGSRRWDLGRRLPRWSYLLPLPADRVTAVSVTPVAEGILVLLRLDEARLNLTGGRYDDLLAKLSSARLWDVTGDSHETGS